MLGLIAHVRAREGEELRLEELLLGLRDWVRRNEPDTLLFELYAVHGQPRTYRIVEEFADQAAWDRHRAHAHVAAVVRQVNTLLEDKSAEFIARVGSRG
jgi:quinol monooxygenase YgiN